MLGQQISHNHFPSRTVFPTKKFFPENDIPFIISIILEQIVSFISNWNVLDLVSNQLLITVVTMDTYYIYEYLNISLKQHSRHIN